MLSIRGMCSLCLLMDVCSVTNDIAFLYLHQHCVVLCRHSFYVAYSFLPLSLCDFIYIIFVYWLIFTKLSVTVVPLVMKINWSYCGQ